MNIKLGDYITAKIDGNTAEFKVVLYHEVMHNSNLMIEVACIANGKIDPLFDKSVHAVPLKNVLDLQNKYLAQSKKGTIIWTDEFSSNKKVYWFRDHQIVSTYVAPIKPENDFCVCKSCHEPIYMAGPNQEDGSFICYPCRDNPIRIYY